MFFFIKNRQEGNIGEKMGMRDGSFSHFSKARNWKLGIRDGSFSHFS